MIGRFFYTFENCVSMGTFYCVHFLGSYRVFFLPGFQSDLVASHSQTEEMPRPFGFYLVFFLPGYLVLLLGSRLEERSFPWLVVFNCFFFYGELSIWSSLTEFYRSLPFFLPCCTEFLPSFTDYGAELIFDRRFYFWYPIYFAWRSIFFVVVVVVVAFFDCFCPKLDV